MDESGWDLLYQLKARITALEKRVDDLEVREAGRERSFREHTKDIEGPATQLSTPEWVQGESGARYRIDLIDLDITERGG